MENHHKSNQQRHGRHKDKGAIDGDQSKVIGP